MATKQVESAAVYAVQQLISLSNNMTCDEIKDGDTSVSFDGSISIFYNGTNKVEDFNNKIDVQIKGRTHDALLDKPVKKYSLCRSHLQNYQKVGGTILFVVLLNEQRTEFNIYVRALLPYEINAILKFKRVNNISIQCDYLCNRNNMAIGIKKLEDIINQFLDDKTKQYSFKDKEQKTYLDFQGIKGSYYFNDNKLKSIKNPADILHRRAFMYFKPEEYNEYDIPCGFVEITKVDFNNVTSIQIGDKYYDADVLCEYKDTGIDVCINNCIKYDSFNKSISIDFNNNLSTALVNVDIVNDFIKEKNIIFNGCKLSIRGDYEYDLLYKKIEVIHMLDQVLREFSIDKNPIIDFKDGESINNLFLLYNGYVLKKSIPFNMETDFLLTMKLFDLSISIISTKQSDGAFIINDLYSYICKETDVFRVSNKLIDCVLHPNTIFFQPCFTLDVSYLTADNIIDKLDSICLSSEKVLSDNHLKGFTYSFINEALKYYDDTGCDKLINYLKKLAYVLKDADEDEIENKIIAHINYYQIIKRTGALVRDDDNLLRDYKNKTDNHLIKLYISSLLGDKNECMYLYDRLTKEDREGIKSLAIYKYIDECLSFNNKE